MTNTNTEVQEEIVFKSPKMWNVIILNDSSTTMEFVIEILQDIFEHGLGKAQELTLEIHNTGSAVAGVYNFEVAEQKAIEATTIARSNGYPLQLKMEEE